MKLYRAANRSTAKRGAHFSPERDVAFAYTENQGFGGQNVYEYDVKGEYRLDLFKVGKAKGQRAALDLLAQELEYDDPRETVREWRNQGFVHPFQVIEDDKGAREKLEEGYEWISFVDDFPQGAQTWRYLGDAVLEGEKIGP